MTDFRVSFLTTTQNMLEEVCPLVLERFSARNQFLKRSGLRLHRTINGDQTSLHITTSDKMKPTDTPLLDAASLLDLPDRISLLADLCEIASRKVLSEALY